MLILLLLLFCFYLSTPILRQLEITLTPVLIQPLMKIYNDPNICEEDITLSPVRSSDVTNQYKSSHYYLYSAFNNANCVKAALKM